MTPTMPTHPGTTVRNRLSGLAATVTIATLVAGIPVILIAIGANPVPTQLSWDGLTSALSSPDDGSLALGAFALLAWVAWVVIAISVITETAARIRGISAPRLPGLRLPQSAAGGLVTAAALLFVAVPITTQLLTPAPAHATDTASDANHVGRPTISEHNQPKSDQTNDAPVTAVRSEPRTEPDTVEHTVKPGETLWSIAADQLGSGTRYADIVALNTDTLGAHPDFLHPGMVLRIPSADTPQVEEGSTEYTVKAGDTLSEIALEHLNDADRYPEIFGASQHIIQPDGRHLSDPDMIVTGWRLDIPDSDHKPTTGPVSGGSELPEETTPQDTPGKDEAGRIEDDSGKTRDPALAVERSGDAAKERDQVGPRQPVTPTPTHSVPSARGATDQAQSAHEAAESSEASDPPWMLAGLTGGGTILAGSLMLALRRRRRAQFRARRPGRTIATPPADLSPVEKTVILNGTAALPTVELLDTLLRRLASTCTESGRAMPDLIAVELTETAITLHLSEPDDLPPPWQPSGNRRNWSWATSTAAQPSPDGDRSDTGGQPAPYPLLVTIGQADTGEKWLLNLENLGTVSIAGDPTFGDDLVRYLVAELATNPWSSAAAVDCVGTCHDVAPMNPQRITHHRLDQPTATCALAEAVAIFDRASTAGLDVATARSAQTGDDTWASHLLVIDALNHDRTALKDLLDLIHAHPGRTGTAVLLAGHDDGVSTNMKIELTSGGRLLVPDAGLDLIAVGLTTDEAMGCTALLTYAENFDDNEMPVDLDAEEGWRAHANTAGALRTDHTVPRHTRIVDIQEQRPSVLPATDDEYLRAAATTTEDLQILAPQVPANVRDEVEAADPGLDAEVAAWFSDNCDLPRLTLLGPVKARTRGAAVAVAKRRPYYTEMLAYLATNPHGVTSAQIADAFSITPARARTDINVVRTWLGTHPRTGVKHLPAATESAAAKARGLAAYQVDGLLVDADLFRRLRVRGEARGHDGIDDLRTTLRLVTGQPFDQLRAGGWSWLLEGDRLDHHMTCAVVDVAHIVTTDALHRGDLKQARAATELAGLAAPFEEIPRLDLAAVATAEGHGSEAERILRDDICNQTDDDLGPTELSDRTEQIIRNHHWLDGKATG